MGEVHRRSLWKRGGAQAELVETGEARRRSLPKGEILAVTGYR